MKRSHVAIALACIFILAAAFFAWKPAPAPLPENGPASGTVSSGPQEGAHVVKLTKDGFTPSELTVKKGETITFTTDTGLLFWPASNPHPSHTTYGGFDPKEPIEANKAWSFTFDLPGTWSYHDHLAPYYTGTITVTE